MTSSTTSPSLLSTLLSRTWRNALATLMPQVSTLVTLLCFSPLYGHEAGVVIGLVTTVLGTVSIFGIGGAVVALRSASIQRRRAGDDSAGWNQVLRDEFSAAWMVGAISLVLTFIVLIPTAWIARVDLGLLMTYMAGNLLWFAVTPVSLVANGILQALDLDGRNLRAAVGMVLGQVLVLAVVLAWHPPLTTALLVTALGNGVVAVGVLGRRLVGIARVTGQPSMGFAVPWRLRNPWRLLRERALAGADGLVYMTTFFVASTIAARQGAASGADIAAAVAVMRLAIIPVKQLGLIGGRMSLQAAGALPLLTVARATIMPCALAAGAVLGWAVSPLGNLPPALGVLMALQILLEPFAGVLFAAVKVVQGPERGSRLLMGVYWLGAVPALILLGAAAAGTPVLIWSALILARIIFAGGSLRLALHPPQ